jgi:hypothetical protein
MSETAERNQSLWLMAASPAIWLSQFLLSYATAAIWCGKVVGRDGSLWTIRITIAAYTLAALIGIGITGWIGFRRQSLSQVSDDELAQNGPGHDGDGGRVRQRLGTATGVCALPDDADTPEDRHRFLGFATVLLSGLSAIATVYVGLAAVFIGSCL